jgi:hypothetical protein
VGVGCTACELEADGEGLGECERLGDGCNKANWRAAAADTSAWVDSALGGADAGADCGGLEDDAGVLAWLLAPGGGTETPGVAGIEDASSRPSVGDSARLVEGEHAATARAATATIASVKLARRPVPVRRGMPHADTPTRLTRFASGRSGRSVTRHA